MFYYLPLEVRVWRWIFIPLCVSVLLQENEGAPLVGTVVRLHICDGVFTVTLKKIIMAILSPFHINCRISLPYPIKCTLGGCLDLAKGTKLKWDIKQSQENGQSKTLSSSPRVAGGPHTYFRFSDSQIQKQTQRSLRLEKAQINSKYHPSL